jgi:hypothetical protein
MTLNVLIQDLLILVGVLGFYSLLGLIGKVVERWIDP